MIKRLVTITLCLALMTVLSTGADAGAKSKGRPKGAAKQTSVMTAEETKETLEKMGVMGGAPLKYIKSADTDTPPWNIHLFNVEQNGMILPVIAYVNQRDIVVGIVLRDGKLVMPKIPLAEMQPVMSMGNVGVTVENRKIFNAELGGELIFVFVDPECPYCQELEAKLQKYHGKYRVVMKHFPIEQLHPGAARKAIDKQCLWMKDTCAQAGTIVDQDIQEGNSIGVYGTPFFVDGKGRLMAKIPDLK